MLPVTLRDRTSAVLIHMHALQDLMNAEPLEKSLTEAVDWLLRDLEELAQIMYAHFLTHKED